MRRSTAKFFHPSSTLEGPRKVDLYNRRQISVLSRLPMDSKGLLACASLDKSRSSQKRGLDGLIFGEEPVSIVLALLLVERGYSMAARCRPSTRLARVALPPLTKTGPYQNFDRDGNRGLIPGTTQTAKRFGSDHKRWADISISAARSPMTTQGAMVLLAVTRGMIDPSAIRTLSMPYTLRR